MVIRINSRLEVTTVVVPLGPVSSLFVPPAAALSPLRPTGVLIRPAYLFFPIELPQLLEDVLVTPPHSITKQVNEHFLPGLFYHTTDEEDVIRQADIDARNKFFNDDGTGVGYYTDIPEEYGRCAGLYPTSYRVIQPPINDPNLRSLTKNNASRTIFAHVRMATSAVHQYNNHPFAFGKHLFMHNGAVALFSTIRRQICDRLTEKAHAAIEGSTDSEHLAALYLTYLAGPHDDDWERTYSLPEMFAALQKAINTVLELQATTLPSTPPPGADLSYMCSSLNLCTTDGEQLIAVRFRDVLGDLHQPPSLYMSTTAGSTLNSKFPAPPGDQEFPNGNIKRTKDHGAHVIIASEPTTFEEKNWTIVEKNMAVLVDKNMQVRVKKMQVTHEYPGMPPWRMTDITLPQTTYWR